MRQTACTGSRSTRETSWPRITRMNTDKSEIDLDSVFIRENPWQIEFDLSSPTRHRRLRHGLRLQQQLVALRKEEKIGDVLLLLEHKPVITLGRNAKAANIIASPELLAQRGVELFECDRGGDVTFHGPGQIVGYPIFDLRGFATPDGKRKTLGAVEFVRRLEEVLIRTCADFAIPTKRVPGLTGVWTTPEAMAMLDVGTVRLGSSSSEAAERATPANHVRSQTRRHRRPHLPLRHLARLRPQRKHRSQLLQPDHPLRHHGKAGHVDAARTRQANST